MSFSLSFSEGRCRHSLLLLERFRSSSSLRQRGEERRGEERRGEEGGRGEEGVTVAGLSFDL
jgi:hypothetical protein